MDRCYSCGKKIRIIKDKPYLYDACGLNVKIFGITQYVCDSCGESYVSLPQIDQLHRVIGAQICVENKALLMPEEIKFLRKDLHLKSKELAKTLGVTPSQVSRWENGQKPIGEAYDRLLRSIYMMHAEEEVRMILKQSFVDMFKDFPKKRKKIEKSREIDLNPQDWMNLSGFCPA